MMMTYLTPTKKKKNNNEYIKIPKLDTSTNRWSYISFGSREEFTQYVDDQFKEPGLYKLTNTQAWNKEGIRYFEKGYYTEAPRDSKDYILYWEREKIKCRRGVIIDDFYLPRDYYMWINYLPIYDKEAKRFKLAEIWDTQYHMSLYELRAELHYKHCPILKKRQIAFSYFHMGKIINQYWFEEGSISKVGASKENYVADSWKFLNEYRDHLNQNTGWYRASEPNKTGSWQQKQKITEENRDIYIGLKSIIKGTTFDKDPTAGVGGPCTIFYHEEGGIAPRADMTFQFMLPALKNGAITTGIFIIGGSVGDLKQCNPLKEFITKPAKYDMLAVPYKLDSKSDISESGLFIPQNWSMPPFIDAEGNSLVEEAKEFVLKDRKQKEKDFTLQEYQTYISQAPLTIREAFDYRTESIFPLHLVNRRRDRIRLMENRPYVCVELEQDSNGKIKHSLTNKSPILKYPVDPKQLDKEGIIQVFNGNFPEAEPKWGTYYSGIDPVDVGKTVNSESLFSVYIYKNLVEKTSYNEDGDKSIDLEGDEMVACWTGRFDDVNHTNERAEMLVKWYNAWGACENNIKSFIQHMMKKKSTKYLASPKDLPFVKEIAASTGQGYEYGVRMTQSLKNYIFEGIIDYLKEEIGEIKLTETKSVKIYGVDKIYDEMILEEMINYSEEANTDRLIAFGLALAFAKSRQANGLFIKDVKYKKPPNKDIYKTVRQMFNSIGYSKPKSGFRNLR